MGCSDCLEKIQSKLSDKCMTILNIIAVILILISIVMRFVYVGRKEEGAANLFFVILTIYLVLFIAIFVLAEFRNRIVRKYFNFLDGKFGRGCFIMFMALLILGRAKAMEIIFGILIIIIAFANCLMGWGQESDGKDAQLEREM